MRQRAAELRNWIYNRPEKNIALVTHGGFLHYLTEDWTGYDRARGAIALKNLTRLNIANLDIFR